MAFGVNGNSENDFLKQSCIGLKFAIFPPQHQLK